MAKKDHDSGAEIALLDHLLTEAGYDVAKAKAGLSELNANKGKAELGEVHFNRWVDDHFHNPRPFFIALAKAWLGGA